MQTTPCPSHTTPLPAARPAVTPPPLRRTGPPAPSHQGHRGPPGHRTGKAGRGARRGRRLPWPGSAQARPPPGARAGTGKARQNATVSDPPGLPTGQSAAPKAEIPGIRQPAGDDPSCRASPRVTCRSCATWAFPVVSRRWRQDQSQIRGISSASGGSQDPSAARACAGRALPRAGRGVEGVPGAPQLMAAGAYSPG
jgi:hypothetical protein